jgi:FkbM family methyltransferase
MSFSKNIKTLRKTFLTKSYKRAFGHFGDDIAIECLYRETFGLNALKSGFYVDVGSFHPTKYSNTFRFYKRGWDGVEIDLEAEKLRAFRMLRPRDLAVQAAVSQTPGKLTFYGDHFSPYTTSDANNTGALERSGRFEVETRTLTDILDETKFRDREIDLLDIDCEGMDLEVLRSLDFNRYRPKIVAVEIHAPSIAAVQNSDEHAFLVNHNYSYVNRVGPTSVFLRSDVQPTNAA